MYSAGVWGKSFPFYRLTKTGTPLSNWHICHGWRSNNSCLKSGNFDQSRAEMTEIHSGCPQVQKWLRGCCWSAVGSAQVPFPKLMQSERIRSCLLCIPGGPRSRCRALGLAAAAQLFLWPRALVGELTMLGMHRELTSWCSCLLIWQKVNWSM